jgi:hypothetical protein
MIATPLRYRCGIARCFITLSLRYRSATAALSPRYRCAIGAITAQSSVNTALADVHVAVRSLRDRCRYRCAIVAPLLFATLSPVPRSAIAALSLRCRRAAALSLRYRCGLSPCYRCAIDAQALQQLAGRYAIAAEAQHEKRTKTPTTFVTANE